MEAADAKGEVSFQILSSLFNRGARFLSQKIRAREQTGDFIICLICDLRDSYFTPDDLLIHLRKIKNVRHAQGVSLRNNMFDGLLFPLLLMESERSVAVSSNWTFQIQDKLKTEGARASFLEAGAEYGKLLVNNITEKLDKKEDGTNIQPSIDAIQDNLKGRLKASGWGRFNWHSDGDVERTMIHDPPTIVRGGGAEGNLFLQGIVAGIVESLHAKKFSIIEDRYDAQERLLTLSCVDQKVTQQVEVKMLEQATSAEKSEVLGEIEKIIQAIETKPTQKPDEANLSKPVNQQTIAVAPTAGSGSGAQVVSDGTGQGPGAAAGRPTEKVVGPIVEPTLEATKIETHASPENPRPASIVSDAQARPDSPGADLEKETHPVMDPANSPTEESRSRSQEEKEDSVVRRHKRRNRSRKLAANNSHRQAEALATPTDANDESVWP